MAVDYSIPNWIRPADTAAHYAQGLQIGARIGAEQAAQQFQQQQLFREQQRDEFERQLASQKQQIAIDQITRKQRAGAQYQMLVQGGMDPFQALQQVGPDLADPAELVALQQKAKQQEQQMQWLKMKDTEAQQRFQMHEQGLTERAKLASEDRKAELQRKSQANQARLQIQTQQALEKDGVLKGLTDELQTAQGAINRLSSEGPSLIGRSGVAGRTAAVIAGELAREKQNAMELQTKIRQREAELRQRMSVLATAESDNTEEQPAMAPLSMGENADQTTTAAPEPAASTATDQAPTVKRRKFQSGKFIDQ